MLVVYLTPITSLMPLRSGGNEMKLTDERRKVLTEYLGECWHDMSGQEVFSCLKGSRSHIHSIKASK